MDPGFQNHERVSEPPVRQLTEPWPHVTLCVAAGTERCDL
jgi:hypothetical protein